MPADTTQSNAPEIDGEEILAGILDWVEEETPSHDGAAVNRLADQVQAVYQALGTVIERTPGRDGFGDILRIRTPGRDSLAPGLGQPSRRSQCDPRDGPPGPRYRGDDRL